MEVWTQVYNPLGNLWLSALVAALPIVFFFVTLAVLRWEGYLAGLGTIVVTVIIALTVYGMPAGLALRATANGMAFGLWPISWIILNAVFLYKLSVKSGQFEIIRSSVVSITKDQRLQVILIGFAFGAFLEGSAGFGAPVAITAAILAALGLNPLYAAGLCLIANTAPVAFGALGIPILVAGKTAGIDPMLVGKMAGRQLPLLSVFVPIFLVWLMDGLKGVRETWPAVLVAGGTFAVTQFFTSNFIGPELPDITSALLCLVATTAFLKFWQPREAFVFSAVTGGGAPRHVPIPVQGAGHSRYTTAHIIKAWSPFIILTVIVVIWSLPAFKAMFAPGGTLSSTVLSYKVSGLHELVIRTTPVVAKDTPYAAIYNLDLDLGHRYRDIVVRGPVDLCPGHVDSRRVGRVQGHADRSGQADIHDRVCPRLRLHCQLLGNFIDPGAGVGLNRAAVPVLRAGAWLARRIPDRLRYVKQRAVRQSAKHHGPPDRCQRCPHGGGEQHWRGYRQDDFAPIDCRCVCCRRPGRPRIGAAALYGKVELALPAHHLRCNLRAGVFPDWHDPLAQFAASAAGLTRGFHPVREGH